MDALRYIALIFGLTTFVIAFKCLGPTVDTLGKTNADIPEVTDPTSIDDLLTQINLAGRYQEEDWFFMLKLPGCEKFFYASSSVGWRFVDNQKLFEEVFKIDHIKSLDLNRNAFNAIRSWVSYKENAPLANDYLPAHIAPNRYTAKARTERLLTKEKAQAFADNIGVWELAFNDQEYSVEKQKEVDENNMLKPFSPLNQHFGSFSGGSEQQGMRWKPAHSKWILSIDKSTDALHSHVMQHSLPRTPVDYYSRTGKILPLGKQKVPVPTAWSELGFRIIPEEADRPPTTANAEPCPKKAPTQTEDENTEDETADIVIQALTKGIWKMSQHVFCYSFKNDIIQHMLTMLLHTYPRFVNTNFSPHLFQPQSTRWSQYKNLIWSLIKTQPKAENGLIPFIAHRQKCENYWSQKTQPPSEPQGTEISRVQSPKRTAEKIAERHVEYQLKNTKNEGHLMDILEYYGCTLFHRITKDGAPNGDVIIAHAPHMVQERSKTEKGEKADSSSLGQSAATYFGPIHWLAVAQIIDTSLLLSTWKNNDLPAIYGLNNVAQIEKYTLGDYEFVHGRGHEKIAFSTDENTPYVCFGDSNHRKSEITHAGLTICIKNAELRQKLHEAVDSIAKIPFIGDATRIIGGYTAEEGTGSIFSSFTANGQRFYGIPDNAIIPKKIKQNALETNMPQPMTGAPRTASAANLKENGRTKKSKK